MLYKRIISYSSQTEGLDRQKDYEDDRKRKKEAYSNGGR